MPISYRQEVYRKLIHLSSLWMVAAIYYLPTAASVAIFALLCLGNVLLEYGHYRHWPVCFPVYELCFGKMLRHAAPEGRFELSGSPYVLASACLTALLFAAPFAVCAFAVMLLGDTAAALVGRKFGRTVFSNGKSLEGFIAFFVMSVIVLAWCAWGFQYSGIVILAGTIGILLAALAEFFEKRLHVDDNFSIPLIVGAALTLGRIF